MEKNQTWMPVWERRQTNDYDDDDDDDDDIHKWSVKRTQNSKDVS